MNPACIIGIGNRLMGDDGVGIRAIEYLRQFRWREDTKLIDAGTIGTGLIHLLENCENAIIIDAADFGGRAGEIKVFDSLKLEQDTGPQISLHSTNLSGVLTLAKTLGYKTPKITIVAIQPKEIRPCLELSDECRNAVLQIRPYINL